MLQVGRASPDSTSTSLDDILDFCWAIFWINISPSAPADEFLAKNSSAGDEGKIKIKNFRSPQKTVSLKLMQWNNLTVDAAWKAKEGMGLK